MTLCVICNATSLRKPCARTVPGPACALCCRRAGGCDNHPVAPRGRGRRARRGLADADDSQDSDSEEQPASDAVRAGAAGSAPSAESAPQSALQPPAGSAGGAVAASGPPHPLAAAAAPPPQLITFTPEQFQQLMASIRGANAGAPAAPSQPTEPANVAGSAGGPGAPDVSPTTNPQQTHSVGSAGFAGGLGAPACAGITLPPASHTDRYPAPASAGALPGLLQRAQEATTVGHTTHNTVVQYGGGVNLALVDGLPDAPATTLFDELPVSLLPHSPSKAKHEPASPRELSQQLLSWVSRNSGIQVDPRRRQAWTAYVAETVHYATVDGLQRALAYNKKALEHASRRPAMYDPVVQGPTDWQARQECDFEAKQGERTATRKRDWGSGRQPKSENSPAEASGGKRRKVPATPGGCTLPEHKNAAHTAAQCYKLHPHLKAEAEAKKKTG